MDLYLQDPRTLLLIHFIYIYEYFCQIYEET